MRLRPPMSRSPTYLIAALVAVLLHVACRRQEQRYPDPATTFRTYKQALAAGDFGQAWSCYSERYRRTALGDSVAWASHWQQTPSALEAEVRREIASERLINDRIAYLMFDPSTLSSPQTSPFFYFIHESDGWKMTTHLDTLFHQELEKAIARGEFKLPEK